MNSLLKELFESYLKRCACCESIITSEIYSILKHHRIDMLLLDNLKNLHFVLENDENELLQQKEIVINRNQKYLEEMSEISIAFNREKINFVFLKGGALILNSYREMFYRYFSDIDILVSYDDIPRAENILYGKGYIQGEVMDGKIIKANRRDILYQRLHTHEIYNMVKLDDKIQEINVDINFLFTWNGFDSSKENLFLENFLSNILHVSKMNTDFSIFNNELQFVHLCSHLYNEAVFFTLDSQYISGTNPKEILLFRLLDILIISMQEINIEEVYSLSTKINCVSKIEYVLSLIDVIMGQEYTNKFSEYFEINTELLNIFYGKNGNVYKWPIDIHQRLFDFKIKDKALKQLKEEGCI